MKSTLRALPWRLLVAVASTAALLMLTTALLAQAPEPAAAAAPAAKAADAPKDNPTKDDGQQGAEKASDEAADPAVADAPSKEDPTKDAESDNVDDAEGDQEGGQDDDADLEASKTLTITAVGDVALTTNAFPSVLKAKGPKLFDPTRKILKRGDLVFLNLETPLTKAPTTVDKKYAYTMPPERLDWLLSAGFNMFSLANNHSADAGEVGVRDTLELMEETAKKRKHFYWNGTHLNPKDAYKPTIIKMKGVKVGFLAVGNNSDPLVNRLHIKRISKAIAAFKKDVDVVVLSVHWGKEYAHEPKKRTVQMYRTWIDAGVDLILGHHPHVIRGIEKYKKGLIVHSLGNFAFSSRTVRHRKTGARLYSMIAEIKIKKKRLQELIIHPLYVNNLEPWKMGDKKLPRRDFDPLPVKGKFAKKVLDEIQQWSDDIDGNKIKIIRKDNRGIIKLR